jgi:hypothetical protein
MNVEETYTNIVAHMNMHNHPDGPAFDLVCELQDLFGHIKAGGELPKDLQPEKK